MKRFITAPCSQAGQMSDCSGGNLSNAKIAGRTNILSANLNYMQRSDAQSLFPVQKQGNRLIRFSTTGSTGVYQLKLSSATRDCQHFFVNFFLLKTQAFILAFSPAPCMYVNYGMPKLHVHIGATQLVVHASVGNLGQAGDVTRSS